jgi:hypothetical protein
MMWLSAGLLPGLVTLNKCAQPRGPVQRTPFLLPAQSAGGLRPWEGLLNSGPVICTGMDTDAYVCDSAPITARDVQAGISPVNWRCRATVAAGSSGASGEEGSCQQCDVACFSSLHINLSAGCLGMLLMMSLSAGTDWLLVRSAPCGAHHCQHHTHHACRYSTALIRHSAYMLRHQHDT